MSTIDQNPLLQDLYFPPFGQITPDLAEVALTHMLRQNRQSIDELTAAEVGAEPEKILRQLEEIDDRLGRVWSPISHLNSVQNSAALREVYQRCLANLTEYGTEMGQHQGLFSLYQRIADSAGFSNLSTAHRQMVTHGLRDFTLAGIALPTLQQTRYKQIKARLSELGNQFSNNVLDATQNWFFHTQRESELAGLPANVVAQAANAAKTKGLEGWVISLDFPAYLAAVTYAENRELREQMYRAYTTRASEQGPSASDNSDVMAEILQLRNELAELLGYPNYAQLSLTKKMANDTHQVIDFLTELAAAAKPVAQQEWLQLQQFGREVLQIEELQAWDLAYASEKLKQRDFNISQQQLRPYFPAETVLAGMFQVVKKLFDIDILSCKDIAVWHSDVKVFEIQRDTKTVAHFYLDLYARADKRGGAWMDVCRARRLRAGELQNPIAYLTCNFTPPLAHTPSLLSFDEVTTLFHEFGHGLHHMLTEVDVAAVSGINGVPWDAVELPSQFLENWCWQPEVVPFISSHYQTQQPLPPQELKKLLAAKNFQAGMAMVRQLEFALFDFKLHQQSHIDSSASVQQLLDQVRAQVAVIKTPEFNRFQHSFSHIFAGGYAAGYYSYKWAEVLSADAFSRFEQEGIFNQQTGRDFLQEILQRGGCDDALEMFIRFRGRAPITDALLNHAGIRR